MTSIRDLAHASELLDAGKLEMQRPWGDWVPVRRREANNKFSGKLTGIPVFMERQAESAITIGMANTGFIGVRVSA